MGPVPLTVLSYLASVCEKGVHSSAETCCARIGYMKARSQPSQRRSVEYVEEEECVEYGGGTVCGWGPGVGRQ